MRVGIRGLDLERRKVLCTYKQRFSTNTRSRVYTVLIWDDFLREVANQSQVSMDQGVLKLDLCAADNQN